MKKNISATEAEPLFIKRYKEMKKKHPDAILLFRTGDFYEIFGKDAVDASAVLGTPLTTPLKGKSSGVELTGFPHHALDTYLPKLVGAGKRVAICEQLEDHKQKKTQEHDHKVVELVTPQKVENTPKVEPPMQEDETKNSKGQRGTRGSSMTTVNGDKITGARFYDDKKNPEKWYFIAELNGRKLRPRVADTKDVESWNKLRENKKRPSVEDMVAKYYPSIAAQKLGPEAFSLPATIQGVKGQHVIERFNPYKEKTLHSPDYDKWKFYAKIDGVSMSIVPSRESMSAYFDKTMSIVQLVEREFGPKLRLPGAYTMYHRPEGMAEGAARVHKVKGDDRRWYVSAKVTDGISTKAVALSYDDAGAYFAKAATADQLAGKYLQQEFMSARDKAESVSISNEQAKSKSVKL